MDASCQCGRVAFKTPLPKPLALYICHCEECRRQSSSAFGCSAIFPKFPLPCREELSVYSRPTASGATLNCYFCRTCGVRIIHSTPGKDIVSVKGGCIEGLDWKNARHIWTRHAMVPIPEGAECSREEPEDEDFGDLSQSDGGGSSRTKSKSTSKTAPKTTRTSDENKNTSMTFADGKGNVATHSKKGSTSKLPSLDDMLNLRRMSLGKGKEDDEIRG